MYAHFVCLYVLVWWRQEQVWRRIDSWEP